MTGATDMWAIYDRLIDDIPGDIVVGSYLVGSTWTLVEGGGAGIGMAMTYRGGASGGTARVSHCGRLLRDLAGDVKSWNLPTASVGMAAVNAWHNDPEVVRRWVNKPLDELRSPGAFETMLPEMAGKKVAVIGHFPGLEPVAEIAELTVLERNPAGGDLPDFACEYVLPEQDYVLITGTTVTNKTLPRLLQLCEHASVAIVGPSLPFAPWWFDCGVDLLAGAVVVDRECVWKCVSEGGHREVFEYGAPMINIRRHDLA